MSWEHSFFGMGFLPAQRSSWTPGCFLSVSHSLSQGKGREADRPELQEYFSNKQKGDRRTCSVSLENRL